MIKLAICGGPAEKYAEKCLNSWLNQVLVNFQIQVVVDPIENDKTVEIVNRFKSASNLNIKINNIKCGAMANFVEAFKLLNPMDDDILVTVDLDDWAYSDATLATVQLQYDMDEKLLLTHGSWIGYPDQYRPTNNFCYTPEDFKIGVRKVPWRASHLRTFKYKLWKRIDVQDLKCGNEFVSVAYDLAMMWPMLEMAGIDRIKFLPQILYTYNRETEFNDDKCYPGAQEKMHMYLSNLKPYQRVEF